MRLRHRILLHLRQRFQEAPPSLRLVFWDGDRFDFAQNPAVTLTIAMPQVIRHLATGNMSRLGDAYVRGGIRVDGTARDIISVGVALADRIGRSSTLARLAPLLARLPGRHTRRRDAVAISYHYDVSNDFYALWLDREMIYSCAYFVDGGEDIDTAQRQKLDHICRKLRLKPGERLLDIGCGWGGLLRHAAKHYGVGGVGITLSRRQYGYARARIAAERLSDSIEIRQIDYRDLDEPEGFDKVVSVGMYEHVGLGQLRTYFGTVQRLLKPGGLFLNHGITNGDPVGGAGGLAGGDFIERYVFPGGEVPHLARAIQEIAAAGLEVADIEDLRPHYARTLRLWGQRLERVAAAAEAAAGEENYRIWRIYMAGMGYAFDRGWYSVAQTVAYRPVAASPAPRPWTRDHVYGGASVADCTSDWI
ncbi:class I SAM-dependent methyltransferase [Methylobacterium sp. CM6257]